MRDTFQLEPNNHEFGWTTVIWVWVQNSGIAVSATVNVETKFKTLAFQIPDSYRTNHASEIMALLQDLFHADSV